jgi:WD40 repeat protein
VGQSDGEIALFTEAALRKGEGCTCKLRGHKKAVQSVAFGSNGQHQKKKQLLASGSEDNTVRLWDIYTKQCVAVLEGHIKWVNSVAFSPDGRLLASASHDSTVRLWDVVKRKAASPVHVLAGHTSWVNSVSFSPDGRQLASGSVGCTVRLWSVPEGVPGPVLQHAHPVGCAAFSPVVGSNMLASGSYDSIIRLWDVSAGNQQHKPMRALQGHCHSIKSLVFSPDGSQLVSGSYAHCSQLESCSCDATVRLSSVASGKLLKTLTLHRNMVNSVAFHPNGKQVVSSSYHNNVHLWTVCEWSDRTHLLFGEEIKRLVFCLMCIKEKIGFIEISNVPQLPMALWLDILHFCVKYFIV